MRRTIRSHRHPCWSASPTRRATADLSWLVCDSWRRRASRPSCSAGARVAHAEPLESRRLLAAGDLDPTFGGDGRVLSNLDVRGGTARDVVVQSDGKFVALISGRPEDGSSTDETRFIVARYNADGAPDTSFSGDGRVDIVFDGNVINRPAALALQPDGKIVAVGTTFVDFTGAEIAVARLNANGSFDNSFSDDGMRSIGFSNPQVSGNAVAVGGGKIAVAGTVGNAVAVIRLNANGLNDTTFSGDGKTSVDFSGSTDVAFAVAIDGSQRVIVAGTTTQSNGQSDFAVARLTSGGSLDGGFAGGRVETDFFTGVGSNEIATSLVVQGDGRIVAGGTGKPSSSDPQFVLARYNTNGTLDNTFDGDGRVETPAPGFIPANETDLVLLGDQRIVLGGSASVPLVGNSTDFRLLRYSTTGQRDTSFGQGGVGSADFYGKVDVLSGLAAVPGGGFVAAGGIDFTFGNEVPGFARFDATGNLVTSFGIGGRMTDGVTGVYGGADAVARQGDKTVVLGATSRLETASEDLFVARFNANGSLDTTFGSGGYTFLTFGSTNFIGDLAVQADGRLVGLVRVDNPVDEGQDLGVFRLTSNGQVDTSFGSGGTFTTSFGRFEDVVDLVIAPDQKIVATGLVLSQATGSNDTTVVRLTTSGVLDSTFDGDGKLQIDLSGTGNDDAAGDVLILFDGRIILGGFGERRVFDPSARDDADFMLARLTTAGALDPTFGSPQSPGVFRFHAGDSSEFITDVELLADGRLLAIGRSASAGITHIMRFTASGIFESELASPQFAGAGDLLVQPDGKIVVAGSFAAGNPPGPPDFAVERFLANGAVDSSFGNNGVVLTDFASEFSPPWESRDGIAGIFYTADNKLLAVGTSFRFWDERVALARYLAAGGPTDPTTPSIAIEDGVLWGRGTGGNDTITIRRVGGDNVIVQVNSTSAEFDMDNFPGGVRLEGFGGDDRITVVDSLNTPVARRVTINGGAGNDTLTGNDGNDSILGGDGDDTLIGNAGNDTLDGGNGFDFADGGGGANTHRSIESFAGGAASIAIVNRILTATGTGNAETITIERTGADNVIVKVGSLIRGFDMDNFDGVLLQGLGGNDAMRVIHPIVAGSLARKVTLEGGAGNDSLTGSGGEEVIRGGDGKDTLIGLAGDDALFGNAGDDSLFGGFGEDFLDGGDANDFIDGGDGAPNDTVRGGNGTDTAEADPGDDVSNVETIV